MKKSITVNGISFNMIYVEPGTIFTKQKTTLNVAKGFWIGETVVTQLLFYKVCGYNPSHFLGEEMRPVESVDHNDIIHFLNQIEKMTGIAFRLPTPVEAEFAGRGGIHTKHYDYAGSNNMDEVAWHSGNSGGSTRRVAQLKPNEIGMYDFHGNVWELVALFKIDRENNLGFRIATDDSKM